MRKVGLVFNKFPRVIRDLSKQLGKEMVLNMEGQDVELDKTIIDLIHDPLTHIIRNSIDHGIEMPDVRVAASKDRVGTISLSASIDSGRATITVIDDGKGIDAQLIKQKIIEKGLLDQVSADILSDSQLINYIFEPAFSTNEDVTDISGRGVGMNVVKNNLEQLNAQISIDTEVGKGTTFTFKIPLTIAIINGVVVKYNDFSFIIPQTAVKEFVDIKLNDACRVDRSKDIEFLFLRDELIPIVNISHIADGNEEPTEMDYSKFVVIQSGDIKLAIVVTSIEKIEETLLKKLPSLLKRDLYSSLTISPRGDVIPVLNTEGILSLVGLNETNIIKVEKEEEEIIEYTDYLRFGIGNTDDYILPIDNIERIVAIDEDDLYMVADKTFYYVRDIQYKIIDLAKKMKLEKSASADKLIILVKHEDRVGFVVDKIESTIKVPKTTVIQTVFKEGLLGTAKVDDGFVGIALDVDYFLNGKGGH